MPTRGSSSRVRVGGPRVGRTTTVARQRLEDILAPRADFAEPGEMETRFAAEADDGPRPGVFFVALILMTALGALMGATITALGLLLLERV